MKLPLPRLPVIRVQYGLATLLAVTTLLAVLVAGPLRRARLQHEARDWVAEQRGHSLFKYGYGSESEWYATDSDLAVPDALVQMFGIDVFNPVKTVVFDCDELKTLEPLTRMASLRNIHVNIEMADEIDFSPIADLPRLESIHFTKWSYVTARQLSVIRSLVPDVLVVAEAHSDFAVTDR